MDDSNRPGDGPGELVQDMPDCSGLKRAQGIALYPLSNPDLDYLWDLGYSGQEALARGIHANKYRAQGVIFLVPKSVIRCCLTFPVLSM